MHLVGIDLVDLGIDDPSDRKAQERRMNMEF
jgi:hypothetical protein